MSDWITLKEAALHLGKSPATLRWQIMQGGYDFVARKQGRKWEVLASSIDGTPSGYAGLEQDWLNDLRTGLTSGNPLRPSTVHTRKYGLKSFWKRLGKTPDVLLMTADNLRAVLASYEAHQFSGKENVLKAFISFYEYLVARKKRSAFELESIRAIKLKRKSPPRRTSVSDNQFKRLIITNDTELNGRTAYDVMLTRTLLLAYRLTGARRNEVLNLELNDVDLINGILRFSKTKNYDTRFIGICPELLAALRYYWERRPKTPNKAFFVSRNGKRLDPIRVGKRIRWVAKKAGLDITIHGFRRSMITEALKKGVPIALIQKVSGHKTLSALQQYNMTKDADAIKAMQDGGIAGLE